MLIRYQIILHRQQHQSKQIYSILHNFCMRCHFCWHSLKQHLNIIACFKTLLIITLQDIT